jgi:uncharacterized protein (TIGR03083 family)
VTLDGRGADITAGVARRTGEVVAALDALDESALLGRSALPGWSRLTIACHLRYGARALVRMTGAALRGEPAAYYPGGRLAQRPATLEPAPGEAPAEVASSLADHGARLHELWSGLDERQWRIEVREPGDRPDLGALPLVRLALLRLTEVEVHGTDLDVGLAGWSDLFVGLALPFRLDWLNARRANHRAVDAGLQGSWLLSATDGPTYLLTVEGPDVESRPAPPGTPARATIEASSRDLLALLLGRPLTRPPTYAGDTEFAESFPRAFPGP